MSIGLFSKQNECLTDSFFNKYVSFCTFKPVKGSRFVSCLTYMSEDTNDLVFLQSPIGIDQFVCRMNEINEFYDSLGDKSNSESRIILNQTTRRRLAAQLKDPMISTRSEQLYCAKWEVDGRWYRVKFLRDVEAGKRAVVIFVDFGNREIVEIDDMLIIPEKFELFGNLPYQVGLSSKRNEKKNN